ncbi:hypothetical protein J5N97_025472 [Dioscorea zingiberensis]|uniref:FAD-binding PCMH-type domain-containing protein n=1 Tax=Dioscorea zingiberensis TaxID=325984 RepID=A0A9D5C8Y9_9LILI|nr:hypothetical protein J5N97_025472 [Dioscorea zingiberensis]
MALPIFLLLLLITFSSLLSFTLTTTTTTSQDIATCLSSGNVLNFTTPSSASSTTTFNLILNFSIQNLRFSSPDLPKPAAIILPSTLPDLRAAVLCCRAASLSIRIRSGGHSYEGLSYLADHHTPFALIDMMNLNQVRLDAGSLTAWVQAGATLGETYYAIAESSDTLGFSAGSCPTVGSGGHIAGGGFGLLSRKYGLAADNIVDAILVDSSGRVLDRESMGDDVFWAIRGGGGGTWGVVFAWRIKLLPVPKIVTGFIVSRPGSTRFISGLVHKWQRVGPSLPDEFYLAAFVGAGLPEMGRAGFSATFKGFYLGPKSDAVEILNRRFPELGLIEPECHEMSWIDSVVFFSQVRRGIKTMSDLKDPLLQGDSSRPRSRAEICHSRIGMGICIVSKDMIEWTVEDEGRGKEYMEWLRGLYELMGEMVSRGPRAAYVNYLDLDLGVTGNGNDARVWGEKYYLGNYDRLVRAKMAIDPDNVFNNPQSIPPSGSGLNLSLVDVLGHSVGTQKDRV